MLSSILETLLQGQFLCQVNNPRLHQELKNEETRSSINKTLNTLGRELRSTENKEAFYCAYIDLDKPKNTRQIQSHFEQLRDQVAPVLHFLTLILRVDHSDAILIPGDTLKFHDLLSQLESETAYLTDLQQISRYELFKKVRTKHNNQDRLKTILEVLEKEGYIFLMNAQSSIYQVTGKIEYFYDCLEFIKDYEQISLQDETDDQKDLNFDR